MSDFVVSSSPHIRSNQSVERIMLDVIISLLPAGVMGIYFFGIRALWIILLSVGTAVVAEWAMQRLLKKPVTIGDLSAIVTGLLLAYNLPPSVPWWIPVIGSFIAIALVKQLFGGLGQNFMNPALAARAILLSAWPVQMTSWVIPGADAMTTATPLAILKGAEGIKGTLPQFDQVLIGNIGGCIGETSALALLLGAAYLFYRGVINWRIPFTYIGTVAFMTWMLGGPGLFQGNGIYNIFAGGLILGAFYMANDYVTSPVTPKGQIIMGIGCGIITSIIRLYGGYPEGVSYSILVMNIVTPLIDKYTVPSIFGKVEVRA
ncbi:RnfABCDGE type electron transport complex subunit D [Xylanivirga thermophila]|jgi:electron transport complex protein RnfD|uniref:RnfABCDGE type electron transport complex subunit D n=1 Tax=Xylanivirga thermophila TaxID=2496273 RepID=UPI00101D2CDC|nr:RnfABCDGE type electron transport complex subunit D [Xylanivirga thermophila]